VQNAPYSQTFRYLNEHRGIFDVDDLLGVCLSDIQRQPKYIRIRFANVDKTRRNKEVHKPVQLEGTNPMVVQLTGLVTDHNYFQAVPLLKLNNQLDHPWVGFRLREHEAPKLIPGERALLIENHPIQVLFQRQLSLFVGIESQMMPTVHLGQFELEILCRPFAGSIIPTVCKQDTSDIDE
jgi:hypothetical protein